MSSNSRFSTDLDVPGGAKEPMQVVAENEEIFETIAAEAEDPGIRERYGEQPLELLERVRERRRGQA